MSIAGIEKLDLAGAGVGLSSFCPLAGVFSIPLCDTQKNTQTPLYRFDSTPRDKQNPSSVLRDWFVFRFYGPPKFGGPGHFLKKWYYHFLANNSLSIRAIVFMSTAKL